jgi:hypothetical protein
MNLKTLNLKILGFIILALATAAGFQNCGSSSVGFTHQDEAAPSSLAAPIAPEATPGLPSFKTPTTFSFYGSRLNGQIALVAQISQPTNAPFVINLKKLCGDLNDSDVQMNNGPSAESFQFTIPAGKTESLPIPISKFSTASGSQILWEPVLPPSIGATVNATCRPWLTYGGSLCSAPTAGPAPCIDRGY